MLRVEFKVKEALKVHFSDLQCGELFTYPDSTGVYMKVSWNNSAVVLQSRTKGNEPGTIMAMPWQTLVNRLTGVLECELM